jgi:hypothetical protein
MKQGSYIKKISKHGSIEIVSPFVKNCNKFLINRYQFLYTVKSVQYDTPRDQGNVSDFTGCQNTPVLF